MRHSIRQAPPELPHVLQDLFEAKLASGQIDLPLLPNTASEVLAACNDEDCNAGELAELVQRDQALAAHVLHIANSAAYAPKEPIVSLRQACSRLGMSTVCEIAVAVSMKGRVFRVPGFQARIRAMWQHSAMTGVYAREVALQRGKDADGVFLGGLMHDIGRPVVMAAFLDILRELTAKQVPFSLLEAAMSRYHAEVGALLADRWGLAPWVREAARHHHDPGAAEEHAEEVRCAHLADELAHWAVDSGSTEADFDTAHPILAQLGLDADGARQLLQRRGDVLAVADAFL